MSGNFVSFQANMSLSFNVNPNFKKKNLKIVKLIVRDMCKLIAATVYRYLIISHNLAHLEIYK